jgi:hypothetical protein
MKKLLLLGGLLMGVGTTDAVAQLPGRPMPEGYTSKLGTAVHKGDSIYFTLGQREDGSFKYAEIGPNLMSPKGMSLPKFWANHIGVVKEVRGFGSTRIVVFKAGVYNAQLDFDAAEAAGEILTRNNAKKATPTGGGVADELLKLKSLLDAGAITQNEFEAQKAKLLK